MYSREIGASQAVKGTLPLKIVFNASLKERQTCAGQTWRRKSALRGGM